MDQDLNWQVAHALNSFAGRSVVADAIGVFFAQYLVFVLCLIGASWWFLRIPRDEGKYAALAAVCAVIIGQVFNLAIAVFLYAPRPFIDHSVILLIHSARDSSFPSDHTTAAFTLAVTAFRHGMPGRLALLGGACLIGISRIFVGVHYPLDVVGGAVLGTFWVFFVAALDPWLVGYFRRAIVTARRLNLA
ncbi:MAG TPA: phosphatase PAP2 family protein [Chloroflexota bacterium]|nr:phosphatase PAP2 family protein [Chloroflexota bacterium]